MKKTYDANIGGTIFHVEDDAYIALKNYLASISAYFVAYEDCADLVADIEGRIAEQLAQNDPSRIVSVQAVERVIGAMGRVDQFADAADVHDGPLAQATPTKGKSVLRRRFFRNADYRLIGGVMAGIAAFTGISLIGLRIAMLVPLLFPETRIVFVVFVLLYGAVWFAVPAATRTTDKLQMRGQSITLSAVDEHLRHRNTQILTRTRKFVVPVLTWVGTIIRRLVIGATWAGGIGVTAAAIAGLITCALFLITALLNVKLLRLSGELAGFIIRSGRWYPAFALCVYFLAALPLLLVTLGMISFLRRRDFITIRIGITVSSLWLLALFVAVGLFVLYFPTNI